jgi:hypothetical protein
MGSVGVFCRPCGPAPDAARPAVRGHEPAQVPPDLALLPILQDLPCQDPQAPEVRPMT